MPQLNNQVTKANSNGAPGKPGRKALSFYTKKFEDYRSTFENTRALRVKEIEYYHGEQLTTAEISELDERKQPKQVHNKVRLSINGMIGVVANSKSDPRAWPRTPNDEGTADVATESLRYAADKTRFDHKKVKMFKSYILPGTTACLIGVDRDRNVAAEVIRWEEYFIDPRSREEDGSDKTYDGIAKWIYATQLADRYPEWKSEIHNAITSSVGLTALFDESFDDRPNDHSIWVDKATARVFVVEMYYKDRGQWYRVVYFAGGVLEEGLSPYKDDKGKPCNPIESVSCYIDLRNVRYGLVKDMIDIQDGINKRSSKLLHLASTSQIEAADPVAIEVDSDTARAEAARPDGVIPYGWKKVSTTDMAAAQTVLLGRDEAELERLGPNPAILGRQGSDSSNVALQTRQQAGLVELAMVMEQFNDFEMRCFRQMWSRMKQFWTAPMWIRVTKEPDDIQFLGLNQPEVGMVPGIDPETGDVVEVETILGYKNKVAEMDVDITLDTQPETATLMAEIAERLMDLVSRVPSYQAEVPFDMFIELLPIPRKTRMMKRFVQFREEQAKKQEAAQQQQLQMAQANAIAVTEDKMASVDVKKAQAQEIASRVPLNAAKTQEALSNASKTAIDAFMAKEQGAEAGS